MEKLIYEINDLEMAMKKNINNSINLITNFMLEKSSSNLNAILIGKIIII